MEPTTNQILDHYRLIERIGSGGMGIVWRAEDVRLGRQVAVKVVDPAIEGVRVDRHLREARAASALNHPGICSVYDIGECGGHRYLVLELLEGRSLREAIGSDELSTRDAIEVARQVADALAVAHSQGIVHRDIKPENLFLIGAAAELPRVKILDFGLAKLEAEAQPSTDSREPTRTALAETAPGAVTGTVLYMSPEQALGRAVDHRTDLFSLGVVLYEMLTGRRPFDGDTPAAIFDGILNRSPPPIAGELPHAPDGLDSVIAKMLEKDPGQRPQHAADVAADLQSLLRGTWGRASDAAPVGNAADRGARPRPVLLLGLLLSAVVVGGLAVLLPGLARDAAEGDLAASSDPPVAVQNGPVLAVLPFREMGNPSGERHFSEGLTEDVVGELSRYRELKVISHAATLQYRGSEPSLETLASELGARYVVRGSVRRAGPRVRLRVELSDTRDGRSLWSRRYERDLTAADLFQLQDELTQQVATAIAGTHGAVARAELPESRRRPPVALASYDCVLRAYEYLHVHDGPKHLAARDCLEEVVRREPGYADGKAWLAYLYAEEYHHRRNERPGAYDPLERSLDLAQEAVALDDASHVAHGVLSLVHSFRGEYEQARLEGYRAIERSPNDSLWLALIGTYLAQLGDFAGGLPMVRRAMELNPHPPGWIEMAFFYERLVMGDYEGALEVERRVDMGEDFREPLHEAAVLGRLGRREEARRAVRELERQWTGSLNALRRELIERHAYAPSLADALVDGAVAAGVEL